MNARQSGLLALVVLALMMLFNSVFVVDQRTQVIVLKFGQIVGSDYAPGLHFKIPFFQDVKRFDGRLLTLDNPAETFLTGDKKNVEVDSYVKWRIADVATYYLATGGQELVAGDRLKAIVNRGLRDGLGTRTVQQLVSGERDAIMQALRDSSADKVKDLGIEVVDMRIKTINLPKSDLGSVYERMRAERSRIAANLRAEGAEAAENIRSDADRTASTLQADAYRDAEKLRGEGDAKAAEIYARAYGQDPDFFSFYRSLSAYRDSFKDRQDVLVVEPKGEFFKYFKDQNGH